LILFVLSPFLLFFVHSRSGLYRNVFRVLQGERTWVGYCEKGEGDLQGLPSIRKGVLDPLIGKGEEREDPELVRKLNVVYAKDYRVRNDLSILFRGVRSLGG
jgi:hypothetical protein